MLDIHGMGSPGERPAAAARKQAQPGRDFGAMLTAARRDARAAAAPQLTEKPKTLADQCRAALERAGAGIDREGSMDALRRIYGRLRRATEREYGHLPPDDLDRLLAMASYAQNTRMEDEL